MSLQHGFGASYPPAAALPVIDTLIAAIALEHRASVFTLDKDFAHIARITRLPLYVF